MSRSAAGPGPPASCTAARAIAARLPTSRTAAANPRLAAPCMRRRREIAPAAATALERSFFVMAGPPAARPRRRGLTLWNLVRSRHGSCAADGGIIPDLLELARDRIEPELGKEGGGPHVTRLVVGGHVARAFSGDRHVDIGLKLAFFIGAQVCDGDPTDVDGDLGVRLEAEALDRHVAPSVSTGWVEKERRGGDGALA